MQGDEMAAVKDGNKVKVHYTGSLDDGTVFDSSVGGEPLEFTVGQGHVIAGFEDAIMGMKLDEKKTFTIPPEEAYGNHRSEKVFDIDLSSLPENFDAEVGQHLQIKQDNGKTLEVTITHVSADRITLDGNHPLAGKALTFEIQVVGIE
jgi:peptidylprolyl isomerase